jgi:hypothetical protein
VGLILSETKLQRLRFGRPTPARTGVALVVQTAGGRTEVIPGQRTPGESLFAPHSMQYEVDTSDQRTRVEMPVKTKEEAYAFQVVVDVLWRVDDPAEVVRRRLDDGDAAISTVVRDRLKELGRQFGIEQTVAFEACLRDEFAGDRAQVGGLRIVLVTPDVTLDAAGATQVAEIRKAEGATTIIQAKHGSDVLLQQNADEIAAIARKHEIDRERIRREYEAESQEREEAARRSRLQFEEERLRREAEFKRRLDIEEAEFQLEREHRAAQRRAELAAWEARSKLDRDLDEAKQKAEIGRVQSDYELTVQRENQRIQLELEDKRTELFQRAIERGDPAMVAVHLGMHPEDAKEFIMAVARDRTATADRQAALLSALIDRKLIISADLDGIGEELIRSVAGMTRSADDRLLLPSTVEEQAPKNTDASTAGTGDV